MPNLTGDTLDAEREALRDSVRGLLERSSAPAEVRRLMESDQGYDQASWTQGATQLGLTGLAIPEEFGGAGYGPLELAVVFEEMGRALYCGPFLSTVGLAAQVLLSSDDAAVKKEWLPSIAAGESFATLAFTEQAASWDPATLTMTTIRSGNSWRLTGTKWFVLDGQIADLILVVTRTDLGLAVFAVPGTADGLSRDAMVTMDATRKMSRLTFDQVEGQLVGSAAAGAQLVQRALHLGAVALAAENVGGAQQCLDMSAQYAQDRVQFGRPIGSFQAIKHKLANMLIGVEQARSALYFAAREAANAGPDLALAASLAKSYTSDAYFNAAADTLQIHGGIGFTWEHPAHLYFKRAKTNQLLLGSSAHHRGLVADHVGI